MLTRMSDSSSRDLREPPSAEGAGILAGLPRTRPQRASARRAASRASAADAANGARRSTPRPVSKRERAAASALAEAKTSATAGKPAKAPRTRPGAKGRPSVERHAAPRERAPLQGFEAEPDSVGPVLPPGSTELIASAAELAGELAKAGVNTGARVLRDFLSRLPG